MRAGQYVPQIGGYAAFVPRPLPPVPPLQFDAELTQILSDADRSLGRLDGVASVLPNPSLFVAMYVRQEAVLSSQIEGTQSTLDDVLQFELDSAGQNTPRDVAEVVNYIQAMNYGLERLKTLPLSLRLIREIHASLMTGARGGSRGLGEFRQDQNWIGTAGCSLRDATFVPPSVVDMHVALADLEQFFHGASSMPILIHCGLIHAQFETIHPFMDGNGRIGRLLITFLLCERQVLQLPLLYLSYYLKAHRAEYYDRLMAIRNDGHWEGWLKFFLRGVHEVSQAATATARAILALRENHRQLIAARMDGSTSGLRLLDKLFEQPLMSVRLVEQRLSCSYATAAKLVDTFVQLGVLREITGWQRNRLFRYDPYLALFEPTLYRGDRTTERPLAATVTAKQQDA